MKNKEPRGYINIKPIKSIGEFNKEIVFEITISLGLFNTKKQLLNLCSLWLVGYNFKETRYDIKDCFIDSKKSDELLFIIKIGLYDYKLIYSLNEKKIFILGINDYYFRYEKIDFYTSEKYLNILIRNRNKKYIELEQDYLFKYKNDIIKTNLLSKDFELLKYNEIDFKFISSSFTKVKKIIIPYYTKKNRIEFLDIYTYHAM